MLKQIHISGVSVKLPLTRVERAEMCEARTHTLPFFLIKKIFDLLSVRLINTEINYDFINR